MSNTPEKQPREALWARLTSERNWDVAVIGGGASGLGVALDAARQGYRVVLIEAHDFAKGTSSRSTKLLHGGVRYLAQGQLGLVREALKERHLLMRNAPHLSQPLAFVMPAYRWWERFWYGWGLRMYEWMAGPSSLGPTEQISTDDLKRHMPQVNARGLRGGVRYWDGQFDDAGMALALARTASSWGALTINHCEVTELVHTAGRVTGLVCRDAETGESATLQARCVINATGVWVDRFRHDKGRPSVTVSQGVHLVVDRRFWPHDQALLIPRTRDGRVLFVVPWLGHVILGTTDTPRSDHPIEPQAQDSDVRFILEEVARYLEHPPGRADVTSVWAGLRPLVRPDAQSAASASQTRAISREHAVWVDTDDLVSVTGGKWTTYRSMAEDVMRHCRAAGLLPASDPTQTTVHLPLLERDQDALQALPGATRPLCPELSEADVRYAVRYDFARTVEDVLARRTRLLFLDAALARRLAPQVAEILISEGVTAPDLEGFMALSRSYELS